MAINFQDSLEASTTADTSLDNSNTSTDEIDTMTDSENINENDGVMLLSADESTDDGWIRNDTIYEWDDEYSDSQTGTVDESKNITMPTTQFSVTQERNSQYIPFTLNRYYDGVDLSNMVFTIHGVNKNNEEFRDTPINFEYNSNTIRFGWLLSEYACSKSGTVKFEIEAYGVNKAGKDYKWITKPSGALNVVESLCGTGNGTVQPSDDWITQFLSQVTAKVAEAQTASQEAQSAAEKATSAASQAQTVVDNAKTELQESVDEIVSNSLSNYYTKTEVNDLIEDIDLTDVYNAINNIDGLANFKTSYDSETRILTFYNGNTVISTETLNSNPTAEWVTAYDLKVESKISDTVSTVQSDLDSYKETINTDLSSIHSDIDGLPETLATDYYTKDATDILLNEKADKSSISSLESAISSVESTANTNKTNITTLGTKVAEVEETINNFNISQDYTYDATYDEEYNFTLWEIENEGLDDEIRTAKSSFKIQGGSGSGSTSSILKIEYITKTPLVVTTNDSAIIKFNFSGTDSSGDDVLEGSATWKVGSTIVATSTVVSGENSFDITDYISLGTQKVVLSVTDDAGSLVTKSWTVQKIDIRIESTFKDTLTYPIGAVSFDYTPYGAVSKEIHFILDGVELSSITTSSSGIPLAYTLPQQTHGTHLLEVYITAEINNSTVESNHLYYDIIWYDETSSNAVISCATQNITVKQYDTTNIVYTVFDPTTESPKVTLAVDGNAVSTLTLDSNTQTWQYKSSDIGTHTLTITCRDTVKSITVLVEDLGIDIEPITANLAFDFNPVGMSNNDKDRIWTDGTVSMSVSDNFDWVNGGYQIDSDGDQYFGIKAGTSISFDYKLFADDAKRNGKEFKLIFKTTNVRKSDATFLSCIDGTTSQIGLQMNVHEAYVYASAGSLYLPYSEEDIIEFEININKDTDIPMVMGYEDGVATRPMIYSDSHNFTQTNPQIITIGSDNCDVLIYRMKAYSSSLTDTGILNNFIADARNADEMIDRYTRNQIYDENNLLTPESLAKACPDLKVIKLECPHFTNDKKDFVKNTNIECIHTGGDPVLDNWTAKNCAHSGQGTTSNEYGAAGRNIDILMCFDGEYKNSKITYDPDYKTILTLGDGTTYDDGAGKVTLTRTSIPTNYFNVKVNIASSENANNALLQKRYNTYLPYKSVAQQNDSRIKNDMEFVNCVLFVKESDLDITTHREFTDCDWHYYALANIGDSKKTDSTRINDATDPKEFIVEIMDNTLPNSTFSGSDEALAALDADQFDENGTYGFRYEMDGITDEQREENMATWRSFYRFVVNSTDEEFVEQLGDWFVLDSALYFYLFTERYTMIDNRSKNTFWHYGKCDDNIYRFDFWDYDNDTAIGINNSGELTMTYGKEDTDYRTEDDPSSGYVFNAAESTFFCRIRDLMYDQLAAMFVNRESQNCWSATSLINQFDDWQSEFPEEVWRLDIERKYLRTYRNGNTRFLVSMMNGRKKYQRRQFERDQEKYMATKYFGTTATDDQIMFRCNTPTTAVVTPNYTLHLTPYANMYLSVMFGATYRKKVRAKAGIQYDIECPFTTMDDTAILIYCASQIQAIGDLSGCYIHDNDFSKATKLQELIIGNATEGYQNTFLTNLTIGNNTLLEILDIQNTPNLVQALNLSGLGNLKELYAFGSGLTGITFADGGRIQIAELPSSITSLTMRNLVYLTNLDVVSFDNLATLVVENCGTVNVTDIFDSASSIDRVRITGINWTLDNTDLLDRIYDMKGIDKNGYNLDKSILSGYVHVPVIREKKLADYLAAWPDLEIAYDSIIVQYAVTFVNDDGTVLDIQYVDKGEKPVDPTTREDNPISIPIKESSVSTDFTFAGWDTEFVSIFAPLTITAIYSESLRQYTIRFLSKGTVLQSSTAEYGATVFYEGDIPSYTAEESAYKYYLFDRWEQSGFVSGDKDINAVYDICEYSSNYFDGKELSDLRPVEIYAMTKLGLESNYVELKDSITFDIGYDYSYDDIEEVTLIDKKTEFTGTNYIDTNISIFDEDRSFVLVIDYEFESGNSSNAVLAQCYQNDGTNGFKLWYNTTPKLAWGTSSITSASVGKREVVVLRHIKGETGLHVYISNLANAESSYSEITKSKTTSTSATLVFGCGKADDGVYENYAKGTVYWSKLWYTDLGDEACKNLVMWVHETRTLEMCGFKRYYLSDNSSKRCSMTFIDTYLLSNKMVLSTGSTNSGGWASYTLNSYLNSRLYNAISIPYKQLIKQVKISSSIGGKSSDIGTSDCYINIPSVTEMDSTMTNEPYCYEGSAIEFFTTNASRVCTFEDGTADAYWTRSPNVSYTSYNYFIDSTGVLYGYSYPYESNAIRIMISI